jgi:aminopeptidase N
MQYNLVLFFIFLFSLCFSQSILQTDNLTDSRSQNSRDCIYLYKDAHLQLEFLLAEQIITGSNTLKFTYSGCVELDVIDIDLASTMIVDSVFFAWDDSSDSLSLRENIFFTRENDKISISLINSNNHLIYDSFIITIFFHGKPQVAKKPPWDGGFVWALDVDSLHWVGVACQNQGASLWWPTIDSLVQEPRVSMSFIVEEPYFIVSNGQLDTIQSLPNQKRLFKWGVSNPINNYNVTVNIANYTHFQDTLIGDGGVLDMDYYVLPHNLELAKTHFQQVNPMMHFFENKFGPFPFYEDGYKLVETAYLGMEHQSCISYGNKYQKGYLGSYPKDIDFDFIIIHETAHEWWGNSVSMETRRDMWIHEAFATYSEALYVENFYGYDDMLTYLEYQKKRILNKEPIVTVSHSTTDMYYKGSWMLHTLRTVLNNDSLWSDILKDIQSTFKHQTVNTNSLLTYIQEQFEYDLSSFFDQYLFKSDIPVFQYFFKKRRGNDFLYFKWDVKSGFFNMPLLVRINSDGYTWIYPHEKWQKIKLTDISSADFHVAENLFLIDMLQVK